MLFVGIRNIVFCFTLIFVVVLKLGSSDLRDLLDSTKGVLPLNFEPSGQECSHVRKGGPMCILFPESDPGPFYLPLHLVRQDVREGEQGVPLTLTLKVIHITTCSPVGKVAVDLWQSNAFGLYSAFPGRNVVEQAVVAAGSGPARPSSGNTTTFLRGVQYTDQKGLVKFVTIFPGSYAVRCVHVHLNVHFNNQIHYVDLYFEDRLRKRVDKVYPYNVNLSPRLNNKDDKFYARDNGTISTVPLTGNVQQGFKGTITMAFGPKTKL